MKIYAIADLHLSGNPPAKPMDIFGSRWQNHWQKIQTDWRQKVSDHDIVLLPGDLSWAMRWQEAMVDLTEIIALPGRKILIRGNHDYWWQTVSKMNKAVDNDQLIFLQNNFVSAGDWAICGSRGWICPGDKDFKATDLVIYQREIGRLRLSLEAARQAGHNQIIVMLHFPPTDSSFRPTGFTELLNEFAVQICVYGHLHGEAAKSGPNGIHSHTAYLLVACDATGFMLSQIIDHTGRICFHRNE